MPGVVQITVGLICLLGGAVALALQAGLLQALHHQVPPAHGAVGVGVVVVGEEAHPPGDRLLTQSTGSIQSCF